MNTADIHRIYELETLLQQAVSILLQVDTAIKAMKPATPKRRKLSKAEVLSSFDQARLHARKNNHKQDTTPLGY